MSSLLTISQVKEQHPEAFAKIQSEIKEFHQNSLDLYLQKYGPEPPEKLINLHTKFYQENDGTLVAVEPRGALMHWDQKKSNWIVRGNIYVN